MGGMVDRTFDFEIEDVTPVCKNIRRIRIILPPNRALPVEGFDLLHRQPFVRF